MMAKVFEFRNFLDDISKSRLHIAAGQVDVAAEAPDALDLQRVVEFQVLFQGGTLGLGEGVEDEIADRFGIQRHLVERLDRAVDPHAGGSPRAEVEVGTAAGD